MMGVSDRQEPDMSATAPSSTRRRFIAAAAAAGAYAAAGAPALARSNRDWSDSIIVNALGGLDNPNVESDSPDPAGLTLGARKRIAWTNGRSRTPMPRA
jgi:hypothetical protein